MDLRLRYNEIEYDVKNDGVVAYDGCHKIYLTLTTDERREAIEYGYEIHSILSLPKIWNESCDLRLISYWNVDELKCVVTQFADCDVYEDYGRIVIDVKEFSDYNFISELVDAGVLTPCIS